jgi:16S rRNA processing protein RimM
MPFQDQDQPSSRIRVGKIASAHGVKGLVKVLSFVEDLSLLETVYTDETGGGSLALSIKNPLGKYVLAEIKGIQDRTAAEALGKPFLYAPRASLSESAEPARLVGLPVLDEGGRLIGRVIGTENYGAGDLLGIRLENGKTLLVPLTPDFVPEIGETVTVVNYEAFL